MMLILFAAFITAAVAPGQAATAPTMKVEGAHLDRTLGLYPVFVGSTVNISCSLNDSSKRLRLALLDQILTEVIIVDDDTVMVTTNHQKPDRYFYRCCVDQCPPVWMYDPRVPGVTLQYAYRVVKVAGFSCVAPDYHYINCSWSLPERRPFLWNMTFSIPGYVPEMQKECPPPHVYGNVTVYSCVIGLSSRQEFYKTQDYSIQLSGVSDFSTSTWNGTIHAGINIVQYSPIRKIQLVDDPSENQFTVNWTEPVVISGTVPQYKVLLNRLQSDQKKHIRTYNATKTMLSVNDLDPGVTYQVEVQAKPEQSPFWSNSKSLLVTTATGSSRIGLIVGVSLACIGIVILVAFIIYRGRHLLYKYEIEIPRAIPYMLPNPDVNEAITSKTGLDHRTSDSGVEVDNSSAESSPKPEVSGIITQNPEVAQDTRILLSTHVFATMESNRTMAELNTGRGTDTPGIVISSRELSREGKTSDRSQCSHANYVKTGDIAHAISGESHPRSISSYSLMEKDCSSASGGDILRFSPKDGIKKVSSVSGQQSISSYAEVTTEYDLSYVANYSLESKSGNCKVTPRRSTSVNEDTKTNLSFDQFNLVGTNHSHVTDTDNRLTCAIDCTNENMSDQLNLTKLTSSSSSQSHLNEKETDSKGIIDKVRSLVTGSVNAVSSDSGSGSMSSYVRIEHESKQSSYQSVCNARKTTSLNASDQKSSKDTGHTLFSQSSDGGLPSFVDNDKLLSKREDSIVKRNELPGCKPDVIPLNAACTKTRQSSQHMKCSSVWINDESLNSESKDISYCVKGITPDTGNAASSTLKFGILGSHNDELMSGSIVPVQEHQINIGTIHEQKRSDSKDSDAFKLAEQVYLPSDSRHLVSEYVSVENLPTQG